MFEIYHLSFRYLPSRDLEEIYLEYYGEKKITREEIEICSATVLLAWIGEQTAGAKLVAEFSKQSPFLVEDFHTYFQGMKILGPKSAYFIGVKLRPI